MTYTPRLIDAMNFCDCGNLLIPVVAATTAYFECSVCKKRHQFKEGNTLIRMPIVPPLGEKKDAHILRYLSRAGPRFATVDDTPCPACGYKFAKVYISESTWYGCMKCHHTYSNPAPKFTAEIDVVSKK